MGASIDDFVERRGYPRAPSQDAVKIVVRSGLALDAVVVDRSLRGMRVRLDDGAALPNEVTVLSLAGAAAYVSRLAWRSAPYAGLSISRTVDMRVPPRAQEAELHRLWRQHLGR